MQSTKNEHKRTTTAAAVTTIKTERKHVVKKRAENNLPEHVGQMTIAKVRRYKRAIRFPFYIREVIYMVNSICIMVRARRKM